MPKYKWRVNWAGPKTALKADRASNRIAFDSSISPHKSLNQDSNLINKGMTYYTIYKTTNKINGKFYIGSHKTNNLDDDYLGSGKLIQRAIQKYGVENFKKEILFVFDNPKEMYDKEAEIVNANFLSENNTYNLKEGGMGGYDYLNSEKYDNPTHSPDHIKTINEKRIKKWKEFGFNHSDETIKILSDMFSKENNPFYGKHHSEESKAKIKAYRHTEDVKQKISKANKGKQTGNKNSQYGTVWINNGVEEKKIKKGESLPNGWKLGVKPMHNGTRKIVKCPYCNKEGSVNGMYRWHFENCKNK